MGLAADRWTNGDFEAAIRDARAAIALNRRLEQGRTFLAASEEWSNGLGHDEAARRDWQACADLVRSGRAIDLPAREIPARLLFIHSTLDRSVGDYQAAAEETRPAQAPVEGQGTFPTLPFRILNLAYDHDVTASRQLMADQNGPPSTSFATGPAMERARQAEAVEDWPAVIAELEAELPRQQALGAPAREPVARMLNSLLAYALAHTGRMAQARALIGGTPMDCDFCVVTRGRIAALDHDWSAAERWFTLAARRTPSIPFANTAWGAALQARGEPDAAIAKLSIAHAQGPHFADPLELWGEALLAKRDYAAAALKFAEADRYAPRWGRNHMLWGEALMLKGRLGEARRQYQAAAGVDLSKPDRAALNVLLARTASGPLHD